MHKFFGSQAVLSLVINWFTMNPIKLNRRSTDTWVDGAVRQAIGIIS